MSFSSQLSSRCSVPCEVSCSQPVAEAWSQPCVTSCGDSRALVQPPPVLITFPGPILSSCPQDSLVGSSFPLGMGASCTSFGSFGARDSSFSSSCYSRYSSPWYSRYSGCYRGSC